MPPIVHVRGLSKRFTVHKKAPGLRGSVRALFVRDKLVKDAVRGVSFEVGEGEIVGLVGANGAGKTTIVKMLAGIIHPTSGQARVLGHDPWKRHNDFRRQIALIMGQKAQLWWDLPAADCFLVLKEIYRIPADRYRRTLDYLADVLNIGDELNVQIRRLSLGERMKMELIAALLHTPKVVYLDEPTIGLDLSAQRAIRGFILEYRERHAPAMLLTSHYMEDIERLCERILIMREGEIVYDGRLDQVVRKHAGYKVLTIHLQEQVQGVCETPELAAVGEVQECNEELIRLHVPRREAATAAAHLLASYPVADLTLEEPEIGDIIERIMAAQKGAPA